MSDEAIPNEPEKAGLDGFYDKFLIHDVGEIRHHLQRLVTERGTMTVHSDGSTDSLPILLLEVAKTLLWIDVPNSRQTLDQWLASSQLHFEGSLNSAAMRFSCGPAQLADHERRPALKLPAPARILYMQRREFVRREPPTGTLSCHFKLPIVGAMDATIRDIGGGGLAILALRKATPLLVGDVVEACRIDLPEIGEIDVNLLIRHIVDRPHLGTDMMQAGCEFVDLSPAVQRKLFRYLMQLDRDQMSHRRWDE
jgi:c-di-GMP-binding flagellar brake protein YcgR